MNDLLFFGNNDLEFVSVVYRMEQEAARYQTEFTEGTNKTARLIVLREK